MITNVLNALYQIAGSIGIVFDIGIVLCIVIAFVFICNTYDCYKR